MSLTAILREVNKGNPNVGYPAGKKDLSPPIPYKRPVKKELSKDSYLMFKLQSDPADSSSAEISINVPVFSQGSPEEYLRWDDQRESVITGQNLTSNVQKLGSTRRILKGNALAAFNGACSEYENEEEDGVYKVALEALTALVFPKKVVQVQCRYMQYHITKPRNHTACNYVARLVELNNYFPRFLGNNVVPFSDSELKTAFEFNMLDVIKQSMVEHDFDPIEHTM